MSFCLFPETWLFVIGVAVGLSDDRDGTSALAGLVSWLMMTNLLSTGVVTTLMPAIADDPVKTLAFDKIQNVFIAIIAVHSFTSRYKIPKKKEKTGNTTLYSKKHVDEIKNARIRQEGYITVPEACALFNVDRDTIYNRCKWYNIPKKTKGKNVIISIEGLRKVFSTGNIAINNVNEPAIAAHE